MKQDERLALDGNNVVNHRLLNLDLGVSDENSMQHEAGMTRFMELLIERGKLNPGPNLQLLMGLDASTTPFTPVEARDGTSRLLK